MSTVRFIIQICRGVIREQQVRRSVMFYSILAALLLLFLGSTFLDRTLREHPVAFIGFWFACVWITLLAVLLAVFDLLMVRAAARRERRRLEGEYIPKATDPDDPNTR